LFSVNHIDTIRLNKIEIPVSKGHSIYYSKFSSLITIVFNSLLIISQLILLFYLQLQFYIIAFLLLFNFYFIYKALCIYYFKKPIFIFDGLTFYYTRTQIWYSVDEFNFETRYFANKDLLSYFQVTDNKSNSEVLREKNWFIKNHHEIDEELKKAQLRINLMKKKSTKN